MPPPSDFSNILRRNNDTQNNIQNIEYYLYIYYSWKYFNIVYHELNHKRTQKYSSKSGNVT